MTPASTAYLLRRSACQASLLVASARFAAGDWEDLRQEMVLDCLRRSLKFDPSRGDWQGFVRGVVRNHATVLAMRRRRCIQREVLAADLADPESETGDDCVDLADARLKIDIEAGLQLTIDVRHVLNGLPARLRRVALLLCELPVREVCIVTGRSRSSVYQMIRKLRVALLEAGLTGDGPARRRTRNK